MSQEVSDELEKTELTSEDLKALEISLGKLTSPGRDIPSDYNAFETYRKKDAGFHEAVNNQSAYSPCRGHCEDLYGYCDALDVPVYFPDAFNNDVFFFGKYGVDERQKYFVYMPQISSNGKVAVLVHGGAWFSEPNATTNNWFTFPVCAIRFF
jgi:hypothetical protein